MDDILETKIKLVNTRSFVVEKPVICMTNLKIKEGKIMRIVKLGCKPICQTTYVSTSYVIYETRASKSYMIQIFQSIN